MYVRITAIILNNSEPCHHFSRPSRTENQFGRILHPSSTGYKIMQLNGDLTITGETFSPSKITPNEVFSQVVACQGLASMEFESSDNYIVVTARLLAFFDIPILIAVHLLTIILSVITSVFSRISISTDCC